MFLIIISVTFILKLKSNINNDIDNKINDILNNTNDISNKNQTNEKNLDNISNTKENFIVSDAQDFHNYDKLRANIKKEDDNFNKDRLLNPPTENKVEYDKELDKSKYNITVIHGEPKYVPSKKNLKSYITASDFGWDAPFPTVSCSNSSIDDRYKSGPKKLLANQVGCGYPNNLTAENYYRTHYMAQAVKIDDYPVRGWNYNTYSDFTHPTKLNIRILSQNTKGLPPEQTKYRNIPTGYNYGFHNSPAQPMP
jgi:hypothetical protein